MKKIIFTILGILGIAGITYAAQPVFTVFQMINSGSGVSSGIPFINGSHLNASSNLTYDSTTFTANAIGIFGHALTIGSSDSIGIIKDVNDVFILDDGDRENTIIGEANGGIGAGGDAGFSNVVVGNESQQNQNSSVFFNTSVGYVALNANVSGSGNTAIGQAALFAATGGGNIGIGNGGGNAVTTGSNNIEIGNPGDSTDTGVIRIGIPGTQSKTLLVGNIGISSSTPTSPLSIGTGSTYIALDNTGTSTYSKGINLKSGCFAINSSCISGSSGGVPYTGATGDVDLGSHILSTEILRTTGVQGAQLWNNGSFNFFSDNGITQTGSVDAAVGLGKYEFAGSSDYGVFDFNSITGSDKTYTLPDASGGIVLTNGGTAGMLSAWTSSSALTATSTPTIRAIFATSTTATSTFLGTVSVGTASPSETSKFLVSNDGTFPSIYVNKQYGWTGFNATTTAGCIDCTFIVGNSPLPGAQSGGRSVVAGFRLDATLYAKQSWSIDEGPADHRKFQEYAGPSGQWHLGVLNDAETQEGLIFDVQTGTDGVGDATVGTVTIGGGEQDLQGNAIVAGSLQNNLLYSPASGEVQLGDFGQNDTCRYFGYDESTGVAEFYPGAGCSSQTNSLGINVAPTHNFDVGGSMGLTGCFYDGSTSCGSSNNVLTSTGSATSWQTIPATLNATSTAVLTNKTASVSSVNTITPTASSSYLIAVSLDVRAESVQTVKASVTYTDTGGTSRTQDFFGMGLTVATLSALGDSNYPPMTIRPKKNTAITVSTTVAGVGSITYDVDASIIPISTQ